LPTYLDSLAALPEELLLRSRDDVEGLIHRAHDSLLLKLLGEDGAEPEEDELLALLDSALQLDLVATSRLLDNSQTRQDALFVAALILEVLGSLGGTLVAEELPRVLRDTAANYYLRSAILYSLGEYEANSVVVAGRLFRNLESLSSSMSQSSEPAPRIASHAILALVAFLARDFNALRRHVARGLGDLIAFRESQEDRTPELTHEMKEAGTLIGIADSCRNLADSLTFGNQNFYELGVRTLRDLSDWSFRAGESYLYWVCSRILMLAESMSDRSVFTVFRDTALPSAYAQLLANDGIFELWSSQREVFRSGLLAAGGGSAVISLPTGAGKTLVAEAFILRCLLKNRGWGVYVVPTRALISEAERALKARLQSFGCKVRSFLLGTEAQALVDQETVLISQDLSVTVLTPEKLDLYFRLRPETIGQCGFCVVDEAHHLGEGARGALLDNLISRLLLMNPSIQFLLLSPFISNVAEIASWISEGTFCYRSTWQPTRQLKGLARLQGEPHQTPRGAYRWPGGIVFARRPEEVALRKIVLPKMFEAHLNRKRELTSTVTDHATQIAIKYVSAPAGTVIAFFLQPSSAEKCAREVAQVRTEADMTFERQLLVGHVRNVVGPAHELVAMIAKGVAYHHGRLPRVLRLAIERGIRDGDLKFVAATTTLAEGINTPATTVIVAGTTRYDIKQKRAREMDIRDFLNMAGRAGRPLRDTEGQIILVPHDFTARSTRLARSYFFPSDEALKLKSAFEECEAALTEYYDHDTPLPIHYQAMLLALVASGFSTEEEIGSFLGRTLAARQSRRSRERITSAAWHYISSKGQRWTPEEYRLLASTGLSADGAEVLYDETVQLIATNPVALELVDLSDETGPAWLRQILEIIAQVPDLQTDTFRPGSTFPHAEVLISWMNFASYPQLAANNAFSGEVEKVVEYIGAHADRIAWGIGAIYLVAKYRSDLEGVAVEPRLGALPLFLRFGVNSLPASLLCLIGLSDRVAGRVLADAYMRDHDEADARIESLQQWLESLDEETVLGLFADELRPHATDVLATFGIGLPRRLRQRARIQAKPRNRALVERFPEGSLVLISWTQPGVAASLSNIVHGGQFALGPRNVSIAAQITKRFDQALVGTVVSVEGAAFEIEIHGQL